MIDMLEKIIDKSNAIYPGFPKSLTRDPILREALSRWIYTEAAVEFLLLNKNLAHDQILSRILKTFNDIKFVKHFV